MSILVQVMAWCRQATSHYLIQCWPRSLSPYDVTRPQGVDSEGIAIWVPIPSLCSTHNSNVTLTSWHLKSLAMWLFVKQYSLAKNRKHQSITGPLWGRIQLLLDSLKRPVIYKGFPYLHHDSVCPAGFPRGPYFLKNSLLLIMGP